MKLTPPERMIGPNGILVVPWVCPHCDRCYWLHPGVDIVAKRSNARPEEMAQDECREAWQEQDIADNPGVRYAMELQEWALAKGREEGREEEADKWTEQAEMDAVPTGTDPAGSGPLSSGELRA